MSRGRIIEIREEVSMKEGNASSLVTRIIYITVDKRLKSIDILINDTPHSEQIGFLYSYNNWHEFDFAEIEAVAFSKTTENDFFKNELMYFIEEGKCAFLTIKTNLGDFEVAAFNRHDGYDDREIYVKETIWQDEDEMFREWI